MRVVMLVLGMVIMVVGAQGAIRLVADHGDTGVLGWVPGGFAVRLVVYLGLVAAGGLLASRNSGGDASAG